MGRTGLKAWDDDRDAPMHYIEKGGMTKTGLVLFVIAAICFIVVMIWGR